MTKISSLKIDLSRSLDRLKESIKHKESDLVRDAVIQRFEFTFELSWKLMASILQDQNATTYGTKNVIRKAAQLQIVNDPQIWFKFLEARNLTVHTYKLITAKKVYRLAKKFPPLVDELLISVKKY